MLRGDLPNRAPQRPSRVRRGGEWNSPVALRISVIVPVHNGAEFLARCLRAITASDYAPYECIVVDDGSTDASVTIARQFPVRVLRGHGGPFGPASARNRGARTARGEILFFVDADVVLKPDALRLAARIFAENPDVAAVFGSYDAKPAARGLVSQYRNLLHHFVHQNGSSEASTFWAGCGGIRRSVFERVGGFDEERFPRSSIEDIELGYRLRASGYRILLHKPLQGTHLKSWTLLSVVRTDIARRAVPWARLILESGRIPCDLNLKWGQRVSFALIALASVLVPFSWIEPSLVLLCGGALMAVLLINRDLYAFFWKQRGLLFAAACVPLHFLYFLYSGLSYLYVWFAFRVRRAVSMLRLRSE